MKKTLIAVALATLSATSMADVILYGKIKGGVEVTKIKGCVWYRYYNRRLRFTYWL